MLLEWSSMVGFVARQCFLFSLASFLVHICSLIYFRKFILTNRKKIHYFESKSSKEYPHISCSSVWSAAFASKDILPSYGRNQYELKGCHQNETKTCNNKRDLATTGFQNNTSLSMTYRTSLHRSASRRVCTTHERDATSKNPAHLKKLHCYQVFSSSMGEGFIRLRPWTSHRTYQPSNCPMAGILGSSGSWSVRYCCTNLIIIWKMEVLVETIIIWYLFPFLSDPK